MVKVSSATITVKAKDGSTELGEETITVSVIAPSGCYYIMDPNSKDYRHTKGTFNLNYNCRIVLTPSNVSFSNLKIAEWGEDDKTGVSIYKGNSDKTINYFAAVGDIGNQHLPSGFLRMLPCKRTAAVKKEKGGPYINVESAVDNTGIPAHRTFPTSGPTVGKMTIVLPIRYQASVGEQTEAKTIDATIVAIREITKQGEDYVITISKTGTSLSKEKDSGDKSITPVIPSVLQVSW